MHGAGITSLRLALQTTAAEPRGARVFPVRFSLFVDGAAGKELLSTRLPREASRLLTSELGQAFTRAGGTPSARRGDMAITATHTVDFKPGSTA
jgi:hypothetical protein